MNRKQLQSLISNLSKNDLVAITDGEHIEASEIERVTKSKIYVRMYGREIPFDRQSLECLRTTQQFVVTPLSKDEWVALRNMNVEAALQSIETSELRSIVNSI